MSPPFNENSLNSARNNPRQSTVRAYAFFNKQTIKHLYSLYVFTSKVLQGKNIKIL